VLDDVEMIEVKHPSVGSVMRDRISSHPESTQRPRPY
jgi:hypothetical protein